MIQDLVKQRKELGISVRGFSNIIGYSAVWIYKVEQGETRVSKEFLKSYKNGIKKVLDLYKKGV